MPIYEYKCQDCGIMDISHGMFEDDKTECPECSKDIKKMISAGGGIIIAGREANQYSDIQAAKYWRDKNGVRHKVTAADGYTGSATVNKKVATSDEIKARKVNDQKSNKKKRLKLQKDRADKWNKENLK